MRGVTRLLVGGGSSNRLSWFQSDAVPTMLVPPLSVQAQSAGIEMVSILSLFVSFMVSDAAADEKGPLDHTQSVTVAPIKLAHPRAHLEYEGMISQNTSFTAGANYGRLL